MELVHDILSLSFLPWVVFVVKDPPIRLYMEECEVCVFKAKSLKKNKKKNYVGLFIFQIQQILCHPLLITLIFIPVGIIPAKISSYYCQRRCVKNKKCVCISATEASEEGLQY